MPHPLTVLVLATSPSPSPSGSGAVVPPDDTVSPGLLGFLSFLFLGVAVFLIARGLNKQLKRVSFDEDAVNAGPSAEQPPSTDPRGAHDEAGTAAAEPTDAEPASDGGKSQA